MKGGKALTRAVGLQWRVLRRATYGSSGKSDKMIRFGETPAATLPTLSNNSRIAWSSQRFSFRSSGDESRASAFRAVNRSPLVVESSLSFLSTFWSAPNFSDACRKPPARRFRTVNMKYAADGIGSPKSNRASEYRDHIAFSSSVNRMVGAGG
jgi:hypothetical protein